MAGVASSPLRLHAFRPFFQASQSSPTSLTSSTLHFHSKFRRFPAVSCQINPDDNNNNPTESCCENNASVEEGSVDGSTTEATASPSSSSHSAVPELPTRDVNRRVAVASVLGAVGLFLSGRLDFGISLKDLSAAALSYEEALSNGKPTVVEFYADWCEVCRELAPDVYKVEEQYRDRVNFVMLNVDNTKWEQELDEFGVEGIPHFAFLDREGNEEGNVVGRLPRQYFAENVEALVRGEASIPHARVVGQFSKPESRKVRRVVDPRSHG